MKRCICLLFSAVFLMGGCQRLPPIHPVQGVETREIVRECLASFPQGTWRAVHAIEAQLPFRKQSSIIGVTVGDSRTHRLRSAILAIEGLVLFEASYDKGRLKVHRALEPFDRGGFGEGLFSDVSMLFLPPRGRLAAAGRIQNGNIACRWKTEDLDYVQVEVEKDSKEAAWTIRHLNSRGKTLRKIRASSKKEALVPETVLLEVLTRFGYRLRMRLLQSDRVEDFDEIFSH